MRGNRVNIFGNKSNYFFSNTCQVNTKIILLDVEEIISRSTNCDEISNNYFSDIAINLNGNSYRFHGLP